MPRQARKESGTGIYHVMLRGINRQDIFEEAEDYMRMLSCLQQMLGQFPEYEKTFQVFWVKPDDGARFVEA